MLCLLQEHLAELVADNNGRIVYLQLLAPDKARYLQAELKEVVYPIVTQSKASGALKEDSDKAEVCPHLLCKIEMLVPADFQLCKVQITLVAYPVIVSSVPDVIEMHDLQIYPALPPSLWKVSETSSRSLWWVSYCISIDVWDALHESLG